MEMQEPQGTTRGGRYLTFALGHEEFGIQILKVREIIGLMTVTKLPCTPPHVRGIINLRGQVIPVIDLRTRFGMSEEQAGSSTCVIVVEVESKIRGQPRFTKSGIVVDRVCEVLSVPDEQIEDAPEMGMAVESRYIRGIGKVGSAVKILLDIDRVLVTEPQYVEELQAA